MELLKQAVKAYYQKKIDVCPDEERFDIVHVSVTVCNAVLDAADRMGMDRDFSEEEALRVLGELREQGFLNLMERDEIISLFNELRKNTS